MHLQEDAEIGIRIKAAYTDYFVLISILFGMGTLVATYLGDENFQIKIAIVASVCLLYEPLMVSVFGYTIGHRIHSLRVIKDDNQGEKLGFLKAFGRFIIKTILGKISMNRLLNDQRRKSIHDYIFDSRVIIVKKKVKEQK